MAWTLRLTTQGKLNAHPYTIYQIKKLYAIKRAHARQALTAR